MAEEVTSSSDFVPTKCSKNRKNAESDFEKVEFITYKPKNKKLQKKNEESQISKPKSVDMRKLRFEVIKLGTSGMDPGKKEASAIAMAVALGAKPPKNEYKNYKDILLAKSKIKKAAGTNFKNSLLKEPTKQTKRHLYVVGDKVIPAKSKEKDNIKNFLEGYGKPGKSQAGKGFKKKRRT